MMNVVARGMYAAPVLIMTMDAIPGYDITTVLGPVVATAQGKLTTMTVPSAETIDNLRHTAIAKILRQAGQWGANAIVGVRFEIVFASSCPYITAYGTAVRSTPVSADARQQYDAMVREGRVPPLP